MILRAAKSAIVLLFLSVTCAYGQGASEMVAEYFDVLQSQDYEKAATYFDPTALREFRQMLEFISEIPAAEQENILQAFFGPSASQESVSKLSDSDFFGSFLRAIMAQASAAGEVNFDGLEILGEVAEGQDLLHVVTRNKVSVGEIEVEAMEVISLRKAGDSWRLLLSGKMKGMASQLRAALSQSGE